MYWNFVAIDGVIKNQLDSVSSSQKALYEIVLLSIKFRDGFNISAKVNELFFTAKYYALQFLQTKSRNFMDKGFSFAVSVFIFGVNS
jgi:hypothetical protein